MLGRTNMGGPVGGRYSITFRGPHGCVISWSGKESGSGTIPDNAWCYVAKLKAGTYTFVAKLTLDGTETEIYSISATISGDSLINMYPKGALYWYGMPIVGSIAKAYVGTFTKNKNYVSSTYAHTRTWSKFYMTKIVAPYKTTNEVQLCIRSKASSVNDYACTYFYVQTKVPNTAPEGSYRSISMNNANVNTVTIDLGNLSGQELYFASAWGDTNDYSGNATAAHTIYAVWFE